MLLDVGLGFIQLGAFALQPRVKFHLIYWGFVTNTDQAITGALMLVQHSSQPVDLAGLNAGSRLIKDQSLDNNISCGSLTLLKGN